jgi:WD40 repeat protein
MKNASFSFDGGQIVLASTTGIYIYDSQTLKKVTYIETGVPIDEAILSPDGNMVVSVPAPQWTGEGIEGMLNYFDSLGSGDTTIKLLDIETGKELKTFAGTQ